MGKPIKQVANKTWMITDYHLDNFYLLEGEEYACLIDTGIGMGDMMGDVRQFTDKPLKVFLTHGHPDHLGGVYAFQAVPYMNPVDEEIARIFYDDFPDYREEYVRSRGPRWFPERVEELVKDTPKFAMRKFAFQPLKEGDVFDLGGRTLEVISTPGHTTGCVSFLDKKERILFSGDIISKSVILFGRDTLEDEKEAHRKLFHDDFSENAPQPDDNNALTLKKFIDGLKKIWSREQEFDKLAVGHAMDLLDKSSVLDMIDIAERILNKEVGGTYVSTPIRRGWKYKDETKQMELWYKCEK